MEVILVRHTTPNITKGICYGQADIETADSFEQELLPILSEIPINEPTIAYFSSPLQRCSLLANRLSRNVIFDDRLKELNFGDWELKAWDAINDPLFNLWMNDFVNTPTKKGESYIDLYTRTVAFLNELKQSQHQKAVVVTHAGVIRSLWAHVNNIPLEKSFDLKLSYSAIVKLII
ncbi:Alpha-ribazole-5'-phosphate phosphatase [Tenacibaculum sp. 190524A02b]|uniref:alpha-ribazole phosphatase family protein n=1 Tax=Tenacibaculum vairaonense TaxID=3137860 RepID=UPI0032B2B6CF